MTAVSKPRIRVPAGSTPIIFRPHHELPSPRADYVAPLTIPRPAPGVMPSGAGMAMDEAWSGEFYQYAAQGMGLGSLFPNGERPQFLGFPALAELAQVPEYRRMVDTLAQEMTRKWLRITSSKGKDAQPGTVPGDDGSEKVRQLTEAMERYRLRDIFREAWTHDGFFGRGQIYIDVGTTDDTAELATALAMTPRKIRRGALVGFRTVEPIWSYPAYYDSTNPLKPDWYRPRSWYVMGREVHRTRLITLISRELPDMLKPVFLFSGISLTQLAKHYVDNWRRTEKSVSDLLHSFSVWIIKANLGGLMGDPSALMSRVEAFTKYRDNRGVALIDKEQEDVANVAVPLSGLDLLQAQAQERMASVDGFPIIKLLGLQAAGLNASDEAGLKVWYDRVHCQQEHFNPQVKHALDAIQLSEFGAIDPDIGFEWNPLWEPTATEQATIRKTEAETATAYINAGVIDPQEERERLAGEDGSAYSNLDLSIDIEPPADPSLEPNPFGPDDDTTAPTSQTAPPSPGAAPEAASPTKPNAAPPTGQAPATTAPRR